MKTFPSLALSGFFLALPALSAAASPEVDLKAATVYCAAYKLGVATLGDAAGLCPEFTGLVQSAIPPEAVGIPDIRGMKLNWFSRNETIPRRHKPSLLLEPQSDGGWRPGSAIQDFYRSALAFQGSSAGTTALPAVAQSSADLKALEDVLAAVPTADAARLAAHAQRIAAIYDAADQMYRTEQIFQATLDVDDALVEIYAAASYLVSTSISLTIKNGPLSLQNTYLLPTLLVQRIRKKVDELSWKSLDDIVALLVGPGTPSDEPAPGAAVSDYFKALVKMGRLAGADASALPENPSPEAMQAFMNKVARCPDTGETRKAHQRICPDNKILDPQYALSGYGSLLYNQTASNFNQVMDIYAKAAEVWRQSHAAPKSLAPKRARLTIPSDLKPKNLKKAFN